MKKSKNDGKIFIIGAAGYYLLETFWRGYSHWSMAAAGGISLLLLIKTFRNLKNVPLYIKSLLGGIIITGVEFVFGLVFNVFLGMKIWDYSKLKGNIFGQICPLFTAIWCAISFAVSVFEKYFLREKKFILPKAVP